MGVHTPSVEGRGSREGHVLMGCFSAAGLEHTLAQCATTKSQAKELSNCIPSLQWGRRLKVEVWVWVWWVSPKASLLFCVCVSVSISS